MEENIRAILQKGIDEKVFPGCVVAYVKNDEQKVIPHGHFTYDTSSPEVKEDTIYDVASITKTIPTSSLLLYLIDSGRLSLDDKVISFIPEFYSGKYKDQVTLWHLLTYSIELDLPAFSTLKDGQPDDIIDLAIKANLKSEPGKKNSTGEKIIQTNAVACLMGLVIQKVTGKNVAELGEEIFFEPLGMKRSTFFPNKFDKNEIAPTAFDTWRNRLVHGEVHDESTFVLQQKYILGAAGLFSTASDILNFMSMLIQKGTHNGKKFLSEGILEKMWTNQLENIDESMGLGWSVDEKLFMGKYSTIHTFGKTGFTGTVVVGDPEKKAVMVMLSNRIYPEPTRDFSKINAIRREICDIVLKP